MNEYNPPTFNRFPPVVKNLLIANGICYLATIIILKTNQIDITGYFGLHYFQSSDFKAYQLVTYLFLHDPTSIWHILFNMFALWMFGSVIENYWGGKRFLLFYFVCGIGAGLTQELVQFIYYHHMHEALEIFSTAPNGADYSSLALKYFGAHVGTEGTPSDWMMSLQQAYQESMNQALTIGASGAIFGILLAYGILFPNTLLYLYFAIPVKAKYVVIGYGLLELFSAVSNRPGDNVAHYAHLGGMVFGFILIMYWKRKRHI